MSQFPPPQPPDQSPGDDYPYRAQAEVTPMSAAAVVAFISSVLVCIPIITQLVGLILGVVGIGSTSGGRARGRGLAIAAVCISPVAAVVWVVVCVVVVKVFASMLALATSIEPLLAGNQADLPAAVSEVREATFSERLKLQVDEGALLDYAQRVTETHGPLDDAKPAQPPVTTAPDGQTVILHLIGRFSGGKANIDVQLGFRGLEPEIDNITVGDLTLAPEL